MYWDYDDAYPPLTPEEEDAAIEAEWEEERVWSWLNETWSEEWQSAFAADNHLREHAVQERTALRGC